MRLPYPENISVNNSCVLLAEAQQGGTRTIHSKTDEIKYLYFFVLSNTLLTLHFKALSMNDKHYEDLQHIRSMMERSSRFISLSGISGIIAGIVALIASFIAYDLIKSSGGDYFGNKHINLSASLTGKLIITCLATLVIAVFFGIYFTVQKSKRNNLTIWNSLSKKLLSSLLIPLVAGGIFCLALFYQHHFGFIAPSMLIFYGLALMNASKYTFSDVEYLGYCELVLGLAALFLTGYGLIFWAIGFGLLHIIYGFMMQKKYH